MGPGSGDGYTQSGRLTGTCSVSEDARGSINQWYEGVLSVFSGSGFLSVFVDKIRLISHYNMNATPHGLRTDDAHLLSQRGHFAPENDQNGVRRKAGFSQPNQGQRCTSCRVLSCAQYAQYAAPIVRLCTWGEARQLCRTTMMSAVHSLNGLATQGAVG